MKIGISCYPIYGGSGVVATELGKALAARGHQIHFITYSMPFRLGHVTENIYYHEVAVNPYPLFEHSPYSVALTSKILDVVKYEKLDLIHVHYAIPHAISAVQARVILQTQEAYLPVVTTLHGTDITLVGQDPSFMPVVNYSINESDGVTAVSDYLRKETLTHFDIHNDIEVIYNFVDTERFMRRNKEHFKSALCPNGEKVLVHVSNFRPVKRAADVIEVFTRLRREGLAIKLLMVGDGPDRIPCEHLARSNGVYEDVRFLGKQEPVEEILSIADVFVIPSGSETFGLAALEAMACEVPVVSTDIGGLPELNLEGKTGFLCPVGDIDVFTERTRRILMDDELRENMASAARRRALEFDIQNVVPLYEAYYERVLEKVALQQI